MGQKGSKHKKDKKGKKDKKFNNSDIQENNFINDDNDLNLNNNIINEGLDKTSETCPNCKKVYPTETSGQKSVWRVHQKYCKPKPNNSINRINPPPPPPLNTTSTRDKQCPKCKKMFPYNSQFSINLYNLHVGRCRPYSNSISINNYNTNYNSNSSGNPIRVNMYNQGLNNVIDAFGFEKKKSFTKR